MKVKVYVTDKHISEGKRKRLTMCPIALAINEVLDSPGTTVSVAAEEVATRYKKEVVYYNLPIKATNFIDKFDSGKPVEPFSFVLSNSYKGY